MEQWIDEYQIKINNLKNECEVKNEMALSSYCLYMLRFLNGLQQMQSSRFYTYQKKVLWNPMRLFSRYFIEQVNEAIVCRNMQSKEKIIDDIENAVCEIAHVYRNVVDATSNADRQMFTCLSVDTNMYELSPKLFSYYSDILETLVTLYNKEDVYAFLLHPSFKCNTETVNLFFQREKQGKVVLIYIPEKRIEEIKEVPIYLMHESYHVLGKEERCRKLRALYLNFHILLGIKQMIFTDVCFTEDDSIDDLIKEKLCAQWFCLTDIIQYLKKRDESDRIFYSSKIRKFLCEEWKKRLLNILSTMADDLPTVILQNAIDLADEANFYGKLVMLESKIRSNILYILSGNRLAILMDKLIYLYREAYADIACILTLGLEPEAYEQAFDHSISFFCGTDNYGFMREIRSLIVANVIAKCTKLDYHKPWETFFYKKKEMLQHNPYLMPDKKERNERRKPCDLWMPQITDQDLKYFDVYLSECEKRLNANLVKNERISEFRNIIKSTSMVEILSGRTSEQFRKIVEKEREKKS